MCRACLFFELLWFYAGLLYDRQKCSNWQNLVASMQRHGYHLSSLTVPENHVAASLSGKCKTICFKNLNDLTSCKCFHEGSSEGDFYICNDWTLFVLRNRFVLGLKFFNPKTQYLRGFFLSLFKCLAKCDTAWKIGKRNLIATIWNGVEDCRVDCNIGSFHSVIIAYRGALVSPSSLRQPAFKLSKQIRHIAIFNNLVRHKAQRARRLCACLVKTGNRHARCIRLTQFNALTGRREGCLGNQYVGLFQLILCIYVDILWFMRQKEVMRVRQLRFFYRFVQFVLVVVATGMRDVNIHDLILSNEVCCHARKSKGCQIKTNAPQFGASSYLLFDLAGHRGRFTSTSLMRKNICKRHETGHFWGQKLPDRSVKLQII